MCVIVWKLCQTVASASAPDHSPASLPQGGSNLTLLGTSKGSNATQFPFPTWQTYHGGSCITNSAHTPLQLQANNRVGVLQSNRQHSQVLYCASSNHTLGLCAFSQADMHPLPVKTHMCLCLARQYTHSGRALGVPTVQVAYQTVTLSSALG